MKRALLLLTVLINACTVGPNYVTPPVPIPASWHETAAHGNFHGKAWWRHFHDALLNNLLENHTTNNFDYRIAQVRLQTAQAEYNAAYNQLFPRVNVDMLPPNATGAGVAQLLALSASFEADLFGRLRQMKVRSLNVVEAQTAAAQAVRLQVQAEITSSYFELREAQYKLKNARQKLAIIRQRLELLNSNYQKGLASYLNVLQLEALIATKQGEMAQLNAYIKMLLHKIEQITGNYPDTLAKSLLPFKPIPEAYNKISLSIPARILHQRPDVFAAERQVAAAHANIRIAMAELFPKVTLGWLLGWETATLGANLFALQNYATAFFGILNSPVLNLPLHNIVEVRKREKLIAVLNYELTILKALHEVKTQYAFYQAYQKSVMYFKCAKVKSKLALDLVHNNYRKGHSDFNSLLTAQEQFADLELNYWHQVVLVQIARVNLYRVLGGGS